MRHFFLLLFIIIIIFCQYFLYKARKNISVEQKKLDNLLSSKIDFISLVTLLAGYILLVVYPHHLSLVIYFVAGFIIGIISIVYYYKQLAKTDFSDSFRRKWLLIESVMYANTVGLGLIVLLFYNLE